MNLRDYKYIMTVAETQHFGKAADLCHVSQPTLSMQIKKFEDRYQIKLFERDNKNVSLTREGEQLIAKIQNILNAQDELEETIQHLKSPDTGEYLIGAFPTLAPFLLPKVMPEFGLHFPKIKFYLIEERSPDLIQQLLQHKLDAIFLALPLEEEKHLEYMPLFSEDFYVALPKTHDLATSTNLQLDDLRDETLMLLEESHCLSGQALEACAWAGVQKTHDFRATSIETLRQMVANGLGITLIPEMAIDPTDPKICYLPLKSTSKAGRTIGLVWRKNYPHREFLKKIGALVQALYT